MQPKTVVKGRFGLQNERMVTLTDIRKTQSYQGLWRFSQTAARLTFPVGLYTNFMHACPKPLILLGNPHLFPSPAWRSPRGGPMHKTEQFYASNSSSSNLLVHYSLLSITCTALFATDSLFHFKQGVGEMASMTSGPN